MPGARAIGYFAKPPIRKLPNAAERHVAAVTAASGIPASARIDGFTKMMYAIVVKVVIPANISVRQSAPSCLNPKYCSRRKRRGMALHFSFDVDSKRQQSAVIARGGGDLQAEGGKSGPRDGKGGPADGGPRGVHGRVTSGIETGGRGTGGGGTQDEIGITEYL